MESLENADTSLGAVDQILETNTDASAE